MSGNTSFGAAGGSGVPTVGGATVGISGSVTGGGYGIGYGGGYSGGSGPINWQPIATMPEDRKDGRDILFWYAGSRGLRGCSTVTSWINRIKNPTHWADINAPEGL